MTLGDMESRTEDGVMNVISNRQNASEANLTAKIVRVDIRDGSNALFYAYSDDIKGLVVAARSYEDVLADIPRAITEMYAACGESIVVVPAQRNNETEWVKIPRGLLGEMMTDIS